MDVLFSFSSNSSVLYFIILLVSDKLEFKRKQLILPPGSLRNTASEEKGPAHQLTVQDERFLWGVARRHFPPPGPRTEAPLSACPSRLVQKGACLPPHSSLGSHSALHGLLLHSFMLLFGRLFRDPHGIQAQCFAHSMHPRGREKGVQRQGGKRCGYGHGDEKSGSRVLPKPEKHFVWRCWGNPSQVN